MGILAKLAKKNYFGGVILDEDDIFLLATLSGLELKKVTMWAKRRNKRTEKQNALIKAMPESKRSRAWAKFFDKTTWVGVVNVLRSEDAWHDFRKVYVTDALSVHEYFESWAAHRGKFYNSD